MNADVSVLLSDGTHQALHEENEPLSVPLDLRAPAFQSVPYDLGRFAGMVHKVSVHPHNRLRIKREGAEGSLRTGGFLREYSLDLTGRFLDGRDHVLGDIHLIDAQVGFLCILSRIPEVSDLQKTGHLPGRTDTDLYTFYVPETYMAFAYSVDIFWGTDFPYSGVFWTNTEEPVTCMEIRTEGTIRSVDIDIKVNRRTVVHETDCSSHREWKP